MVCAQPAARSRGVAMRVADARSRSRTARAEIAGSSSVEKRIFLRGDDGRATNRLANVAPEFFLQHRDDAVPHAIAERIELLIARVFAEAQPMRADVFVDLGAPDGEQRPNDGQLNVSPTACIETAGSSVAACSAGSAKEVDQKGLHQIVRMMTEKDRAAATPPRDCGEK